MSPETKFGYGFLLAGVGLPTLIAIFFGAKLPAAIVGSICLVIGLAFLISAHRHAEQRRQRGRMATIAVWILIGAAMGAAAGGLSGIAYVFLKPPAVPPIKDHKQFVVHLLFDPDTHSVVIPSRLTSNPTRSRQQALMLPPDEQSNMYLEIEGLASHKQQGGEENAAFLAQVLQHFMVRAVEHIGLNGQSEEMVAGRGVGAKVRMALVPPDASHFIGPLVNSDSHFIRPQMLQRMRLSLPMHSTVRFWQSQGTNPKSFGVSFERPNYYIFDIKVEPIAEFPPGQLPENQEFIQDQKILDRSRTYAFIADETYTVQHRSDDSAVVPEDYAEWLKQLSSQLRAVFLGSGG